MIRLYRAVVLSLVCTLTLEPGLLAFEVPGPKQPAAQTPQVQGQERILQALNRLTFGPRPGDVERVKAMGLEKWIDQQLHPEKIDDSRFTQHMEEYPSMQMGLKDLIKRYPTNLEIRAIAEGKRELPKEKIEHAIYANQVEIYKARRKEVEAQDKSGKAAPVAGNMQKQNDNSMQPGTTMTAIRPSSETKTNGEMEENNASMDQQEKRLYNDLNATRLVNLKPEERLDRILNMSPQQMRDFERGLNPEERNRLVADMTPQQREILLALRNPQEVVRGELLASRMVRDVESERQLEAVMTDFWLNHFNVFLNKGPYAALYLMDYERNVVRPRALGKFEDLLVATAKSPAMLYYLDNYQSVGSDSLAVRSARERAARLPDAEKARKQADRGLNENYAREVMELHTLGVDGGYTQHDVTEVAKVFTGWTIDRPQQGGYSFEFDDRRHQPGSKAVLGKEIQENGMKEGLEVLHMLATSPATAHFISKKIAIRFVSDNPPQTLINRMANTFLKTDGNIREVMKTLFHSPEFWSRSAYRAKVKTPEEFVISAIRASDGELTHPMAAVFAMVPLGMSFYGMQTPNGYGWTADKWVNSSGLLNRINYSLALAVNRGGSILSTNVLLGIEPGSTPLSAPEMIAKLNQRILNGQLTMKTQKTVLAQLKDPNFKDMSKLPLGEMSNLDRRGGQLDVSLKRQRVAQQQIAQAPMPDDLQAAVVVGLLLGSPEFQRR
jgi:uncharacterized protein (DUF1800 family)